MVDNRIERETEIAAPADLVWRAVRDARRRGKPVVVSMGDVAGSGGYYVAAGADSIIAEPASVTL